MAETEPLQFLRQREYFQRDNVRVSTYEPILGRPFLLEDPNRPICTRLLEEEKRKKIRQEERQILRQQYKAQMACHEKGSALGKTNAERVESYRERREKDFLETFLRDQGKRRRHYNLLSHLFQILFLKIDIQQERKRVAKEMDRDMRISECRNDFYCYHQMGCQSEPKMQQIPKDSQRCNKLPTARESLRELL